MSKRHFNDEKLGCSKKQDSVSKKNVKQNFLFGNSGSTSSFCDASSTCKKDDGDIKTFSSSSDEDETDHGNEVMNDSILEANGVLEMKLSQFWDLDTQEDEKIAWSDSTEEDIVMPLEEDEEEEIEEPFKTQDVELTTTGLSIKQYYSEEEEVGQPPFVSNSQYCIVNPTPSPQCVVKVENDTEEHLVDEFDELPEDKHHGDDHTEMRGVETRSRKTRKKAIKGGLVERLLKLRKREQSDLVFWNFHKTERDVNGAIYSQVRDVTSMFSVVSVTCMLTENTDFFIMLPVHIFDRMNITLHSKIRIFPPWNKIFLKERNVICLLCAYRIEVLPSSTELISTPTKEDLVEFQRKQDRVDVDINQLDNFNDHVDDNSSRPINKVCLQNMKFAVEQCGYLKEISFFARVQRLCCRCTGKSTELVPLQQINSQKHTNEAARRFVLLVQDGRGDVGEIFLPNFEKLNNLWMSFISSCEGKVFQFTKLKLTKQIPISKNAPIQSMMSCFEFKETENTIVEQLCVFEYSENASICFLEQINDGFEVKYKPPSSHDDATLTARTTFDLKLITVTCDKDVITLQEILQNTCSFHGCTSPESSIMSIQIHDTCFIPQELVDAVLRKACEDNCIIIRMKDVRVHGTSHIADSYSMISLLLEEPPTQSIDVHSLFVKYLPAASTLRHITSSPTIKTFQRGISVGDIISIQGRICGIDEDSALFWNVCETCHNDDVIETENRTFFCKQCSTTVSCRMKMQLSVFLHHAEKPDVFVLCKLLEDTISSLFVTPASSKSKLDFQGYDMRGILGKSLHLKVCAVLDIKPKSKLQKSNLYILKEATPLCKLG